MFFVVQVDGLGYVFWLWRGFHFDYGRELALQSLFQEPSDCLVAGLEEDCDILCGCSSHGI